MAGKSRRICDIAVAIGLIVMGGQNRTACAQDVWHPLAPSVAKFLPEENNAALEYCGAWATGKTLFQWSDGTSLRGGPDLNEPLITDRPDFTEASSTVGLGVVQLEFGYTFTNDDDAVTSVRRQSFPETLLRYGILAEWLELRIGWNYARERTRTSGTSRTVGGSEDLYLGLKVALTSQQGILPEMALIPQVTAATGSVVLTRDQVLPGMNWAYGWEINDFISTGGSSQFNRVLDEMSGDNYIEFAQSWTVGYSLGERVGAYTEWYAFIPSGADTAKTEHYFNGGFSYLISNNLQLDVRAGVGLNDAADDYFLGTGASVRF